jgi:hypothetical protein
MKKLHIEGKVAHLPINGGFWGIIDDQGQEWRPVPMPEEIKIDGLKVKVEAREVEEAFSIFMWGTPVKIVSFEAIHN